MTEQDFQKIIIDSVPEVDQQIIRREHLAVELHRAYRAAEKAMNRTKKVWRKGKQLPNRNRLLHDHGWSSCGKRVYFRKRAALLLDRADGAKLDGTLQEIENQLRAKLLYLTSGAAK